MSKRQSKSGRNGVTQAGLEAYHKEYMNRLAEFAARCAEKGRADGVQIDGTKILLVEGELMPINSGPGSHKDSGPVIAAWRTESEVAQAVTSNDKRLTVCEAVAAAKAAGGFAVVHLARWQGRTFPKVLVIHPSDPGMVRYQEEAR
jgi:hypothetical protein